MRMRKCKNCGHRAQSEQEENAASRVPVGGTPVAQPVGKPRIKLIVQMFGGAIEQVFQDCPGVEVTDIIFTEDGKYLDGAYDRDKKGSLLFPVASGPLKGQGVYSHYDDVAVGGPELFAPVVKAAEVRKAARKEGG